MTLLPATPEQLLATLTAVFPEYAYQAEDLPILTFHRLLADFIVYFGANNHAFNERQLQKFAVVVNQAVDAGGALENAVSTCFLEHLHQVRARKPLVRFLSEAARRAMHA